MEEGELKKRIRETATWDALGGEGGYVDFQTIGLDDLLDLVDEAKKEFPAWYVVSLPECEGRIYKWDEMTEEQRKKAKVKTVDVDETVVWYVKWLFGGEKECRKTLC